MLTPALAAGLAAAVAAVPGWAAASPTVTSLVRAPTDPSAEPGTDPVEPAPTVGPTTTGPLPTTTPPTRTAPPPTTSAPAPTTAPGDPVTTTAPTTTAPAPRPAPTDRPGDTSPVPSGPPVPGISLHADEVVFDITGGPSTLVVRLGNTGGTDAAGRVDVILPDGVTPTGAPAGCAAASGLTRCELGDVPAGQATTLRLPVAAAPEAQRRAPLAGTVVGRLDQRGGRDRQVRTSFRISAAAALTPVDTPDPTGSQGVLAVARADADRGGSARRTAVLLIVVSGLLVVLALALATMSLRRRMSDSVASE